MVIMVHSSASSQGSLLDWGDLRLIINKSENLCRRLTIGTKSGNYQQVGNLLKAINKRSEISRRQLSGYRSPLRRQWSLTCLSVAGNGFLPIDNWSHLLHLIVDLEKWSRSKFNKKKLQNLKACKVFEITSGWQPNTWMSHFEIGQIQLLSNWHGASVSIIWDVLQFIPLRPPVTLCRLLKCIWKGLCKGSKHPSQPWSIHFNIPFLK